MGRWPVAWLGVRSLAEGGGKGGGGERAPGLAQQVCDTGTPHQMREEPLEEHPRKYGQRQDDDILHNYTVAKVTMNCDFQPKLVPRQRVLRALTIWLCGDRVQGVNGPPLGGYLGNLSAKKSKKVVDSN